MSATAPARLAFGYWMFQFRRTWRSALASQFLSPLMFLAAMGVGLGTLVNRHGAGRLGGVSYLVFLAPGLLAASAMQTGVMESTFPVMGGIKWIKTYHAMLASPLRVVDVLYGHLLYMAARVAMVAAAFLCVMAAFGAPRSAEVLAALPAAVLTGLAFAYPMAAFAATREDDRAFAAFNRFVVIPLFLFSGTFFPIDQLPAAVRPVAWITPLWHGVALCRALSLGTASFGASVGHAAYLAAFAAAGLLAGRRTFTARLAP